MFKFELGIKVKDQITGFSGVVTGRAEHITGCNTYGVIPKVGKDGKIIEANWFDENRLEVIDKKILLLEKTSKKDKGACGNPPIRTGIK